MQELPANAPTIYGVLVGIIVMLTSLLGWITRKFITGDAVSRQVMNTMLASKEQQIADRDAQIVVWQGVAQTAQAQLSQLLEPLRRPEDKP